MPAPAGSFTDVHVGMTYACGVRTDGALACWGNDFDGSFATIPDGTFTAVSVDDSTACALDPDGAISCFGVERYPDTVDIPEGDGFTVLDAGFGRFCTPDDDGYGRYSCW